MVGFFDLPTIERGPGRRETCASCGLYNKVLHPRMEAFGDFKLKILNIGEAPGEEEDRKGRQWQGKVGRRLQREYERLGVDLFKDCLNINSINCRPTDSKGNNRPPTPKEIACCRKRVMDVINATRPNVIVVLGGSPLESVIGPHWPKTLGAISKWRGWTIPEQTYKTWVCPTFHPSYIERQQDSRETLTIWRGDLERALKKATEPFPEEPTGGQVQIIDIADLPDLFSEFSMVSIDFETTGLKPHGEGHHIVCASIAYGDNKAVAFMVPKEPKKRAPLLEVLRNPKMAKIAHNIKFEDTWATVALGTEPQGWFWDTMLGAHVLDNRSDITSLKFQTYVHFGVAGYDSAVESWIKSSDSKNGNAFNKIDQLVETKQGREQLLTYCGLDSWYAFRLAKRQIKAVRQRGEELKC